MRKISEILCCVAILCCALSACSDKQATVKVSSFNIWLNTLGGKLPPSQTAKVIEASQTDIVGIQEGHIYEEDGIKHDHVPEIAESLGFHLFNQGEGHYISLSGRRQYGFPLRGEDTSRQRQILLDV